MRKEACIATLLSMLFAAVSSAQVFYEPVQSQYRTEHGTYYYGGSNPRAHDYAYQRIECFYNGRGLRHSTDTGGYVHRNLISRPREYVVSDCAIYLNAFVYGYTSVDARNAAYANVPAFFRMSHLAASAISLRDSNGYVVRAQAPGALPRGTIDIRQSGHPSTNPTTRPDTRPGTSPTVEPKAILIIPKKTRPQPAEQRQVSAPATPTTAVAQASRQ